MLKLLSSKIFTEFFKKYKLYNNYYIELKNKIRIHFIPIYCYIFLLFIYK